MATYVFFKIVNDQLSGSDVRFYVLTAGIELYGIFLTPREAADLQRLLSNSKDRQLYLPPAEPPRFGTPH